MKAVVAVQRKLLEMIFTIYKSKVPYDKDYLKKIREQHSCSLNRLAYAALKNKNNKIFSIGFLT